ncbi:MAG: hypothetical protein RSA29_02735 [Clostridium sp.]|uniref:hypothetical protein n=1 Tax=Clostridium sp. TaxID=1506 RepID=UPI00305F61DB
MAYKVHELKKGFNAINQGECLVEVDLRPEVYNILKVGDNVYSVHVISDELKLVGVKKLDVRIGIDWGKVSERI